jgi:hypothetical protein
MKSKKNTAVAENIAPIGDGEVYDIPAVAYFRPINTVRDPSDGKFIAAVDTRDSRSAEKSDWLPRLQDHIFGCLSRTRAYPPEEYKAGAVIFDRIAFEVPSDHLGHLFGIEAIDACLARALTSALINGLIGKIGPVDLEQGVRILASFLHAHPHFANVVTKGEWIPPFAEHTGYMAVEVRDGEPEQSLSLH